MLYMKIIICTSHSDASASSSLLWVLFSTHWTTTTCCAPDPDPVLHPDHHIYHLTFMYPTYTSALVQIHDWCWRLEASG